MREALGACPICEAELEITRYRCRGCGVTFGDAFRQSPLASLPPDLASFVIEFLEAGGNIREMERRLGVSYPTVKGRLAQVNDAISRATRTRPVTDQQSVKVVLEAVRNGSLGPDEALHYL